MAHMIPAEPKEFDARSHEGIVFEALKKLPDSYYVFHSVETVAVTDTNELLAKETDFLVVNKQLGALTIEVKAGDNFDVNLHEAITQIPAPTEDLKGKIVDVIETGYQLHDKVIRFAKVVTGN